MSTHEKPDGRNFVSYRDESGRQHTKVFPRGPIGKKQAVAFDLHLRADRKIGKRPAASQPAEDSPLYLRDLAQKYLDDRRAMGNVSEHYVYSIIGLMNHHLKDLINHKPVDELNYHDDMIRVADYYKDRLCSQATRNRYFTYLKAMFRYGIKAKLTKNNPLQDWKKSKEAPRQFLLTVNDLRNIIKCASPHLQWAIDVAFNLGVRPGASELLALKWQYVNFEKREVAIYGRKTKSWRHVKISEPFRDRLFAKKQTAQCDHVVDYEGHPFKTFRRSWQTAVKNAGLPYPSRFYDVRHLYATTLLNSGAPIKVVSDNMGHATAYHTLNTYAHALEAEREKAANLLPDIAADDSHP